MSLVFLLTCFPGAIGLGTFVPLHADVRCPETTVARDRIEALSRGFNLVGWLDRPDPQQPSLALLGSLRRLGFTHVRLPLDGELFAVDSNSAAQIAARFGELDRALAVLLGVGFAVSVDMHPSAKFGALHARDPEAGYRRLEAIWRDLAWRLRHQPPDRVFLELLNEPVVDVPVWREQARRLAAAVRDIVPEHTLIVGEAQFQRIEPLTESVPLADPNVVYAVHYYDPMVFTHQGANWMSDGVMEHLAGIPFPGARTGSFLAGEIDRLRRAGHAAAAAGLEEAFVEPWTADRIDAALATAGFWSVRNKRAVIVNEFGVLRYSAPRAARLAWLRAVRSAAERHCLGWTHWELDQGFGFIETRNGVPELDLDVIRMLLEPSETARGLAR